MAKFNLFETPENDHGCYGWHLEIETIDAKTGRVIGGRSCSSCWQTGCTSSKPIVPIGTIVKLPNAWHRVQANVWDKDGNHTYVLSSGKRHRYFLGSDLPVTWRNAASLAGFSHNDAVKDRDNPQPDSTLCRPRDLVIVREAVIA